MLAALAEAVPADVARDGTQMLQVPSGRALPPTAHAATSDIRVFDLSLEKAGTSSFTDFATNSLGLLSFHDPFTFYQAAGCFTFAACAATNSTDQPADSRHAQSFPDYLGFSQRFSSSDLERVLNVGVETFADMPFGFLLDDIERIFGEQAKYVIWLRDADSWVSSMYAFFCTNAAEDPHLSASDTSPLTEVKNEINYLAYGVCDLCDKEGGARPGVVEANLNRTYRAYVNHIETVFAFFNATKSRASRILYMDYYDSSAGRTLCEFVYGKGAERCADLTLLPSVEPADMNTHEAEDVLAELAAPDACQSGLSPLSPAPP